MSAREKRSEVIHYSTVAYRSSSASQSSIAKAREGAVLRSPRGGPGGYWTGRLLIPPSDVGQGVLRGRSPHSMRTEYANMGAPSHWCRAPADFIHRRSLGLRVLIQLKSESHCFFLPLTVQAVSLQCRARVMATDEGVPHHVHSTTGDISPRGMAFGPPDS